jgi:hypothetical protein
MPGFWQHPAFTGLRFTVALFSWNNPLINITLFLQMLPGHCANELNLSAGYFGDLIKKETGKIARNTSNQG